MKRYVSCCVAVFLVGIASAEKEAELPTVAKQTLARMEATVAQAKKKAIAELTSVMSTETRAGHLEVATKINDTIKALTAELDQAAGQALSKKSGDSLPGKWRMHNTVLLTLDSNYTFSAAGGNFKWTGKWHTENGKLIVDNTFSVDTFDLPPQKETRNGKAVWSLKGKNSKNEPIYMEKEE